MLAGCRSKEMSVVIFAITSLQNYTAMNNGPLMKKIQA